MKILFVGNVYSSRVFLMTLINMKADIVGVLSKTDDGFNSDYEDLSGLCEERKISFLSVDDINEERAVSFVRKRNPDIIYCFGLSQIIRRELLSIPRMGAVGYHPAALPNNRGRHPIIWALALGLKETASTFFFMEEEVDVGQIVSQVKVPIAYQDDAQSLYLKLIHQGQRQIETFTMELSSGKIVKKKSFHSLDSGNIWRKRSVRDGEIDFRMSSRAIYNLVRALTHPYVGAHMIFRGKEVKVWKVGEEDGCGYENIEPGKVICVEEDSFLVKCYDGCVRILDCDVVEIREGEYIR